MIVSRPESAADWSAVVVLIMICFMILLVMYFGKPFHDAHRFVLSSSSLKLIGKQIFLVRVETISRSKKLGEESLKVLMIKRYFLFV